MTDSVNSCKAVLEELLQKNKDLQLKINELVKRNRSISQLQLANLVNNLLLENQFKQQFVQQYDKKPQPRIFKINGDQNQIQYETEVQQKIQSIISILAIWSTELIDTESRIQDKIKIYQTISQETTQ